MNRKATAEQIRAARAALNWSIEELAKASGVSARTIIRYEDLFGVPPSRSGNLERLVVSLKHAGIEFIGTPDDGPGIRLRRPNPSPSSLKPSTVPLAPTPDDHE